MSEYFLVGLNEGGASMLLSVMEQGSDDIFL